MCICGVHGCRIHYWKFTYSPSNMWLWSEPAATSAPTWMDGALRGFSFLSLCHSGLTFFLCPFSALISVFFFFLSETPPPRPTTLHCPPIDLLTYKFKIYYSHQHPPTYPSTFLPTNILERYLPNPTYMATTIYLAAILIDPQWSKTMRKE